MKLKTIMSLALVVMLTACAGPSTSEPTTNPSTNPTVSDPTTSIDNPTINPSTAPSVSDPTTVISPTPVEKYVELTVDSLGIPSETYLASTATVGGIDFEFIQIGNYGNGIQMRDKDGKTSSLWNTSTLGSGVTKIELQYASTMEVKYDNPDAVIFSFGSSVNNYTYTTKLSTTKGTKSYTITPNSSSYSYLHIEHDLGYSMYWDSIKIYYLDGQGGSTPDNPTTQPSTPDNPTTSPSTPIAPQAKVVELTVDSLGIPSETYLASTATVDGVDFEFIQIGNYGNGIQMRDKDGKTSSLWNTSTLGSGVTKIELQYASTMEVKYDNPDAVVFSFGNAVNNYTYITKLSTTKGTKSYTITPNSSSYSYLHIEHDLGYSMYWDSIKIYYGGEPGASNPGTSTPTTTPTQTPTTSKPSGDQPSQGDTYTGNYYDGISTTATGLTLLGELRELIVSTHDTYTSYSDCGGGSSKLAKTDADPNNKSNILLFYSRASVSNSSTNFNREHVWPQSASDGKWGKSGGGADMHHIRPTKYDINSKRGNLPFGEANNGSRVEEDGYLGGYKSGSVFEPLDHVKGDVARIVLYVFLHYNTAYYLGQNNLTTGTVNSTASSETCGNLPLTKVVEGSKEQAFALMVKWHNDDPVDQIEITRNNAVYDIQGNRNPFIDRPSYVNELWG